MPTHWLDLSRRELVGEVMDDPALPEADHLAALGGLRRINAVSFTPHTLLRHLSAGLGAGDGRPRRVLDVACGDGENAVRLAGLARRRGLDWRVDGCDLSERSVAQARALARRKGIEANFFQADALNDLEVEGYDAVVNSLFLHHLEDEQIVRFLNQLRSARLVVISDLVRSRRAYLTTWLGVRLLSRSWVVHQDGPLSVRAALTPGELSALAEQAALAGAQGAALLADAATAGLERRAMSKVDVLVVGAGVAGAFAALGLARRGLKVMLVDRAELPRHKVCGCCLNSEAVGMLHDAGFGPALEQAGAYRIERVVVACRSRATGLTSRGGLAVSRFKLDAMLAAAAQDAGCVVRGQASARVTKIAERPNDWVGVELRGRGVDGIQQVEAGVVLVADGLAGSALSGVDAGERAIKGGSLRGYGAHLPRGQHDLQAGEVVMRCGDDGYVGTVVLEDGSLDVAAALDPGYVKACSGPAEAVSRIAHRSGLALQGLADVKWTATAPLTGSRRRPWLPGVLVLGDAAGYIEPFTGEGMAWALRSAQAVVPVAQSASAGWQAAHGAEWEHVYRASVRRRQWRCRLYSAALRRPRLIAIAIRAAGCLPERLRVPTSRLLLPPMFDAGLPEPAEGAYTHP